MYLKVFEGNINKKGPFLISLYYYGNNKYIYHVDGDYSQITKINAKIIHLDKGFILAGKKTAEFEIVNTLFEKELKSIEGKTEMSENEIRDILYADKGLLCKILGIDIILIDKEYVIDGIGRIDILGKLNDTFVIIELKKVKSNYLSVDQCLRYVNHFQEQGLNAVGYVLTKSANNDHIEYAKDNDIKLISYTL